MPGALRRGLQARTRRRVLPRGAFARHDRPQERIGANPAARNGGDPHAPRPRLQQRSGALSRCGAAREHIVDQQHIEPPQAPRRPPGAASNHGERARNICPPRCGAGRPLRGGELHTREPAAAHSNAFSAPKLLSQQIGGTEPPGRHALGMGRHGHDHIESMPLPFRFKALQRLARQLRERRRESVIAPALPASQQRRRRPSVAHRRSGAYKRRWVPSAIFTNRRPVGHAARTAASRACEASPRQGLEPAPACAAEPEPLSDRPPAEHAGRRKQ